MVTTGWQGPWVMVCKLPSRQPSVSPTRVRDGRVRAQPLACFHRNWLSPRGGERHTHPGPHGQLGTGQGLSDRYCRCPSELACWSLGCPLGGWACSCPPEPVVGGCSKGGSVVSYGQSLLLVNSRLFAHLYYCDYCMSLADLCGSDSGLVPVVCFCHV